jgi:hypothetical protein
MDSHDQAPGRVPGPALTLPSLRHRGALIAGFPSLGDHLLRRSGLLAFGGLACEMQ